MVLDVVLNQSVTRRRQTLVANDECPFLKPFPVEFDDCVAYQVRPFAAIDLMRRALPPVRTCAHLEVGVRMVDENPRYYARCRLGDWTARERWQEEATAASSRLLQSLATEVVETLMPSIQELWEAKATDLRARQRGGDPGAERVRLLACADASLERLERILEQHVADLEMAGLRLPAVMALVRDAFAHFIESSNPADGWAAPPELLAEVPAVYHNLFWRLLQPAY